MYRLALAEPQTDAGGGKAASASATAAVSRYTARLVFFGVVLFLYVGSETSVAGWVAMYAQRLDVASATAAIAAPSLFWGALLVGRGMAPLALRRVTEESLLRGTLVVATAGVVALLVAQSANAFAASVAIAGLGLAAVFPIVVSIFTRELDRDAPRAAGVIFLLAGVGGASLPPLVGLASTLTGSLAIGLFVPLLGCLAMLALCAWRLRDR